MYSPIFKDLSSTLLAMIDGFEQGLAIEDVRDGIRSDLHDKDPVSFPSGHQGTDLTALIELVVNANKEPTILTCSICTEQTSLLHFKFSNYMHLMPMRQPHDCNTTVNHLLTQQTGNIFYCDHCTSTNTATSAYHSLQPDLVNVFFLAIPADAALQIDQIMSLKIEEQQVYYKLKGIIYYSDFHFTCRHIDDNDRHWMIDGQSDTTEDMTSSFTPLLTQQDKQVSFLFYVIVTSLQ
jgi:hypothetical protein